MKRTADTIFTWKQQWSMLGMILCVSGCSATDKHSNLDHLMSEGSGNHMTGMASARRAALDEMNASLALQRAKWGGAADIQDARQSTTSESSAVCSTDKQIAYSPRPAQQQSKRSVSGRSIKCNWTAPKFSDDRVSDTPDLMQTSESLHLPFFGDTYCGPVAVTNAFLRLANHGYSRLWAPDSNVVKSQSKMICALGDYMNTTESGTTAQGLLSGMRKYVLERGYKIKSLTYQGFEWVSNEYSDNTHEIDLRWIKHSLAQPGSVVVLGIGFEKYDREYDRYSSFAHHFVTLVGYGKDKNGNIDENILIVHDPAGRSGAAVNHDYVRITKLSHGSSGDGQSPLYKLTGDLKLRNSADCALLDGAAVLVLNK
jgi:hypothetical protein